MPVLYGVFLYMGVASLNGVQVNMRSCIIPAVRHEALAVQHPLSCAPSCSSSVHGPSEAAPDAGQTPAGPHLPAARPPQEGPPLHLPADHLLGSALDPQVHRGRHRVPCDGESLLYF